MSDRDKSKPPIIACWRVGEEIPGERPSWLKSEDTFCADCGGPIRYDPDHARYIRKRFGQLPILVCLACAKKRVDRDEGPRVLLTPTADYIRGREGN
jgi:hypothetical protein